MAKLWDAHTGRELLSFPQGHGVDDLAFSADGRRILIISADGTVTIMTAAAWAP
jgi:hypothetical protein